MSNQDHLTEELGRELRHRVGTLHEAPLSLDDVRGRARGIQRRRRATAAAAIAAAVAVAVLVPTALLGHAPRAPEPAPAPPSNTGSTTVLHGGRVTLADGTSVDIGLENADVSAFGVLTDGRTVVANQTKQEIEVFAPDGSLAEAYPVDIVNVTMGPTNEVAAWLDGSRVRVLESGHAEPVDLASMPKVNGTVPMLDAVTGDHCADGGCEALVGDGTTTTAEVSTDGFRELATSRPLRITDVSPDGSTWAVAFPPASGHMYGCVGLYDVAGDAVTARTCQTSFLRFSPDGEHLVGGFFENNMAGEITVLDRDLGVVATYAPEPDVVVRAGWADATHVLAATAGLDDNHWTLMSVGLDGSASVVEGPVAGGNPEMVSEYQFSE